MTSEQDTYIVKCDLCDGTGRRFDPTCQDKINAGPNVGQCSQCRGTGSIVKVRLGSYPSASELGALPEWDDAQGLPDWML